jgi:hypothetical protein
MSDEDEDRTPEEDQHGRERTDDNYRWGVKVP